jgi:GNAT superfamily N-acetyltransferase
MELRNATYADCEAIAAIHVASWRDAYSKILRSDYLAGPIVEDRLNVWRARLRDPRRTQLVLIGKLGGAAVGFACAFADEDPEWGALIDSVHVLPDMKRRGFGRRLLSSAAEWLVDEFPGQPMHLWVFEANEPARRFYAAMGGEVVEAQMKSNPGGGETLNLLYFWREPRICKGCRSDDR